MKLRFSKLLVSVLLCLAATAVVISTVLPPSVPTELSYLLDVEKDSEGESENETAKEDDLKEQFAKWHIHPVVESSILRAKLAQLDSKTGNVHLDIFTPPPEY